MNKVIRFFVAIGAGFAYAAHAGVLIETVKRDKVTNKEESAQSMQIQNGMARMEMGGARGMVNIFKNEAMHLLDMQRKTYTVMDRATLEQSAGAMNDAMAQMRAQMANMPPEQRAMMENMMKQRGMPAAGAAKPVFDAKPTGANESVAGRGCKVWDVTRDGVLWQQLCVVPINDLPGKDEFQALSEKMRPLFDKLSSSFGQFGDNPMQQESTLSAKLKGVPFITRRYRDGVLTSEEIIVKTWKTQTIAATQFDIPAGYVKQEAPLQRPR